MSQIFLEKNYYPYLSRGWLRSKVRLTPIFTPSGQAAQFVVISTICFIVDNIISTSYYTTELTFNLRLRWDFGKAVRHVRVPVIVHDTVGAGDYLVKPIGHNADTCATRWIGDAVIDGVY
ncbi:hypothetical protein GLOIN_2v1675844 [Rhizophagus clarus]|uniref:Uncharacterized protein n=1 Tax=Rhizophagus clarus TaxID=94130 RepID=A0A8H3QJU5_9GLOM|nr:hypothetical protein GLOIN_2v1675844 [Rhizophagus clarus]